MKRMLINATHTDEIRVAIADGQKLYDLDIDSAGHYRKKGNIYKAKITRVEPSLEACFVNYGSERHGFLPYKEISPAYCRQAPKGQPRLPINKALKEGDEIIVQVNKEERGNKGAALSTYISLAGRYLVYMPGNHRAGGISRQIRGDKRAQLQDILSRLEIPNNDGVIVRTAGLGCAFEELQWDFTYLQQVWEAIRTASENKNAPFFIYQESDLFIRALRDYLQPDIGEILIDDRASYEKAREFMQQVMPHNLKKLSHYNDTTPLFSRYQIERQIQSAFEREVKLPSGGSLVIDHTEALLSIDINSARATKGADVEATATHTNLEAADEIARQLRIRDLGGLVVIDFIDMRNNKNQREVENRMKAAADIDRARVQVGKISKFGLLEMSRQRLRSSINDSSQITCPTCSGHGFIRSMESLVISIIRLTEEEMIKPKTGKVVIQAPIEVTNKILNEKRTELNEMEKRHKVQVAVISNENLNFPAFHVQRYNVNEANINVADIKLVTPEECHKAATQQDPPTPRKEQAMLQMVKPNVQAPKRSLGMLISSWFKALFSSKKKSKPRQHNKQRNNKPYNKKQGGQRNNKQQQPNKGQATNKNQATNKGKQGQSPNKPQHNKQQPKKQNNKGQNQHAQKQQADKQQSGTQNQAKQQPKPNNQQNKPQAQAEGQQNQNTNNQQTNNQQNNKKPRGKSIYGNKNRGNKSNQNRNDNNTKADNQPQVDNKPKANDPVTDTNTVANKMTRPLGSVADLAAKKEAVVPTGAKAGNSATPQKESPQKPAAKRTRKKKTSTKTQSSSNSNNPNTNNSNTGNAKTNANSNETESGNVKAVATQSGNNKPAKQESSKQPVIAAKQTSSNQPSPTSVANYTTEKTVPTNKPGVHKLKSQAPAKPVAAKVEPPKQTQSDKPATAKAVANKSSDNKSSDNKSPAGDTNKGAQSKPGIHKLNNSTQRKPAAPKTETSKDPAPKTTENSDKKPVTKKKTSKKAATKKVTKKSTTKKATTKKAATKKKVTSKTESKPSGNKSTTESKPAKSSNSNQSDMFSEAPKAKPPKED